MLWQAYGNRKFVGQKERILPSKGLATCRKITNKYSWLKSFGSCDEETIARLENDYALRKL